MIHLIHAEQSLRGFFMIITYHIPSPVCTDNHISPICGFAVRIGGIMNYQNFKQHILAELQTELGSDVKVTIQDIIKNNDTHLDGLTFLSPKQNLSPTIYLNYYFRQYEKGRSLSDIKQDILSVYRENCPSGRIDISFFTDYDKIKSRIIFKLINYERNKELLQKVPHYRFLDLAIVFSCLVESTPTGNATILIHEHHLDFWNITRDDLYALAFRNTPKLLQYDLRNMTDLVKELFCDEESFSLKDDPSDICPMYVLSNQHKLNGAVCILYQNLLRDFANRLGCDLYILPSSIHEVLIIPAYNKTDHQELSDMVRDVNSSQLSREEVLSDHVYYYSRETCQITM